VHHPLFPLSHRSCIASIWIYLTARISLNAPNFLTHALRATNHQLTTSKTYSRILQQALNRWRKKLSLQLLLHSQRPKWRELRLPPESNRSFDTSASVNEISATYPLTRKKVWSKHIPATTRRRWKICIQRTAPQNQKRQPNAKMINEAGFEMRSLGDRTRPLTRVSAN